MQRSTIDEQPGHVYHPGMTEPRRVRFLFDYISPYAYLGWIEIRQIAERAGVVVEPVPVLFAAMLNTHGHLGPAEIAPKRIYIFKDVLRRAHRLGVPLVPPPAHPFNPLLALRVTTACAPEDRERLMDALFASTWGGAEPRGVDGPSSVSEILSGVGLGHLLERAAHPEVKDELKRTTAAAIEQGCFGVPTVDIDGELFWGTDSFPFVEEYLAGTDRVDAVQLAAWRDLPSAAARRG